MNDELMDFIERVERSVDNIEIIGQKTSELLVKELNDELKKAMFEFGDYQDSYFKKMFNSAIRKFYSEYKPKMYKRTSGLKKLLSIKRTVSGGVSVNRSLTALFDPSKLDGNYRLSGEGIYNQVFILGWHGGAPDNISSPEVFGKHPSPGVPYYRAPGRLPDGTFHRWAVWGERASVSSQSPYDAMVEEISPAFGGEMFDMFKKIGDKHAAIAIKNFKEKAKPIIKQYWG